MIRAALILVLMLPGCGEVFDAPQKPEIKRDNFVVSVKESDDLPPGVLGTATFVEGANVCLIKLREYPRCLLHEMRHCIEGAWHGTAKSDDDCL